MDLNFIESPSLFVSRVSPFPNKLSSPRAESLGYRKDGGGRCESEWNRFSVSPRHSRSFVTP